MPKARVNGVELFYVKSGSRTPVLRVHGASSVSGQSTQSSFGEWVAGEDLVAIEPDGV
jgi:hypothetical protein